MDKCKNLDELLNYTEILYDHLVWLARGDASRIQMLKKSIKDKKLLKTVLEKNDARYNASSANDASWEHGFNSGMLAATRLFSHFAGVHASHSTYDSDCECDDFCECVDWIQLAKDNFPELDT